MHVFHISILKHSAFIIIQNINAFIVTFNLKLAELTEKNVALANFVSSLQIQASSLVSCFVIDLELFGT